MTLILISTGLALAYALLILLYRRMWDRAPQVSFTSQEAGHERVSVIVPCRNEAQNIDACIKALQKLAKQRRDSLEQFRNAGREDLALKEEELTVLEDYLPAQMDEAALRAGIAKIIEQNGASGAKDLGKVMPLAMKEFGSVAEGKLISALVRELLG